MKGRGQMRRTEAGQLAQPLAFLPCHHLPHLIIHQAWACDFANAVWQRRVRTVWDFLHFAGGGWDFHSPRWWGISSLLEGRHFLVSL